MKRNIFFCVLALLVLVNVSAIAGEDPKADPAEAPEAKAQSEKERLHVQHFAVFL